MKRTLIYFAIIVFFCWKPERVGVSQTLTTKNKIENTQKIEKVVNAKGESILNFLRSKKEKPAPETVYVRVIKRVYIPIKEVVILPERVKALDYQVVDGIDVNDYYINPKIKNFVSLQNKKKRHH